MYQKDFSKQLIKGKIVEEIFHQMFIEAGKYAVIPFGYEKVMPELVKFKNKDLLKSIRNSPDFVLTFKDRSIEEVLLVEIKYRFKINMKENLQIAVDQEKRWSPSYIFIATPDRFYFGKCGDVIKNKGMIETLSEKMIGRNLQIKYLKLISGFIQNKA